MPASSTPLSSARTLASSRCAPSVPRMLIAPKPSLMTRMPVRPRSAAGRSRGAIVDLRIGVSWRIRTGRASRQDNAGRLQGLIRPTRAPRPRRAGACAPLVDSAGPAKHAQLHDRLVRLSARDGRTFTTTCIRAESLRSKDVSRDFADHVAGVVDTAADVPRKGACVGDAEAVEAIDPESWVDDCTD